MPTLSGIQLRCKARAWCNGWPFKCSVFCRVHEVNMELCHCTRCPIYAVSFHRMLTICIIVWYRVVSLCGSNTSSENRDRRLKFWQQFYNGNTVSLPEYNQIRSTCKGVRPWTADILCVSNTLLPWFLVIALFSVRYALRSKKELSIEDTIQWKQFPLQRDSVMCINNTKQKNIVMPCMVTQCVIW